MKLFSPSSLSLELRRLIGWVRLKCTSTVPVTLIIRYHDAFCFFCKGIGSATPVSDVFNVLIFQLGFAGMPKRGRGGTVSCQGLVSQHQDQEDIPPSCGSGLHLRYLVGDGYMPGAGQSTPGLGRYST